VRVAIGAGTRPGATPLATDPNAAQGAGARLRLASYNVHGCVGRDGRFDPERVLRVIAEIDADAIALQEVDSRRGPHADLFRLLSEGSGLHATAGPILSQGLGHYGNMLLTRWPPAGVGHVDLAVPGREPRAALDVALQLPCGRVRLLATHLGLGRAERRRQRALLTRHLAHDDGAALRAVIADFNVWWWRGPDLFGQRVAGVAPRTFPAHRALLALDRVQVAPRRALRSVAAHRSAAAREASDHLPVVAEVMLDGSLTGW